MYGTWRIRRVILMARSGESLRCSLRIWHVFTDDDRG
jgi:hypothetical protein